MRIYSPFPWWFFSFVFLKNVCFNSYQKENTFPIFPTLLILLLRFKTAGLCGTISFPRLPWAALFVLALSARAVTHPSSPERGSHWEQVIGLTVHFVLKSCCAGDELPSPCVSGMFLLVLSSCTQQLEQNLQFREKKSYFNSHCVEYAGPLEENKSPLLTFLVMNITLVYLNFLLRFQ